jgi:hypothetical protein
MITLAGNFLVENSIAAGYVCLSKLMLTGRRLLGLFLVLLKTGLLKDAAILEFPIEISCQDKSHGRGGWPLGFEALSSKSWREAHASLYRIPIDRR